MGFIKLAERGEHFASSLRTEKRLAHFPVQTTLRQQPQDPLILSTSPAVRGKGPEWVQEGQGALLGGTEPGRGAQF